MHAHITRLGVVVGVAATLVGGVLSGSALAGSSGISGSIALSSPARASSPYVPTYGDSVTYAVTVSGRVPRNSVVQVMTVCLDAPGSVVFQQASWPADAVALVGNRYVSWNGAAADCTAQLSVRDQQKGTITVLARTIYHVNAAA